MWEWLVLAGGGKKKKKIEMLAFFLLVSLATVCSALNYRGVDVSQPASVSAFQCLKSDGYSFAVVRAYQSSGHVDPNAAQTMMNAHEGGMSHVDAYLFPCPTCGTPGAYQQMECQKCGVWYAVVGY